MHKSDFLHQYTIGFTTFHKFRESERVIYKTDGQSPIGGITDNAEYYVKLIDSKTIKLFENQAMLFWIKCGKS